MVPLDFWTIAQTKHKVQRGTMNSECYVHCTVYLCSTVRGIYSSMVNCTNVWGMDITQISKQFGSF